MDCPICNGKGEIEEPSNNQKNMVLKIKTAKCLKELGYSIREIMKMMDYKSPRSITKLLEK